MSATTTGFFRGLCPPVGGEFQDWNSLWECRQSGMAVPSRHCGNGTRRTSCGQPFPRTMLGRVARFDERREQGFHNEKVSLFSDTCLHRLPDSRAAQRRNHPWPLRKLQNRVPIATRSRLGKYDDEVKQSDSSKLDLSPEPHSHTFHGTPEQNDWFRTEIYPRSPPSRFDKTSSTFGSQTGCTDQL